MYIYIANTSGIPFLSSRSFSMSKMLFIRLMFSAVVLSFIIFTILGSHCSDHVHTYPACKSFLLVMRLNSAIIYTTIRKCMCVAINIIQQILIFCGTYVQSSTNFRTSLQSFKKGYDWSSCFSGLGSSIMLFLLILKDIFINCATMERFGCLLFASAMRDML